MKTDEELDSMLRTAMTTRPEPPDATNLAARAIAMARAERRVAASMPVAVALARWMTAIIAAIAMLAVLLVGYAKLATHFLADTTAATTSDGSDLAPTLAVGGVGLIVTLLYLALHGTLSREDGSPLT